MNKFEQNIISIYGDKGREWLNNLPGIISNISYKYGISNIQHVDNLSFNYLVKGIQNNNRIVIKTGLDEKALSREAKILNFYAGKGAVKLISYEDGVLILEEAVPGDSLLPYADTDNKSAIDIACMIIDKLHTQATVPKNQFTYISEWLKVLDKDWNIDHNLLAKAKDYRDELIASAKHEVLLHADLHHDNIINNGNSWLAIDPKGIIGDPAIEYWGIIRNVDADFDYISANANIPADRLKKCSFVMAILHAIWCIEDNMNPSIFINFAVMSLRGM